MSLEIKGPLGVRQFVLEKKCDSHGGHGHNYDHTTFVHRGELEAYIVDDNDQIVKHMGDFGPGEFIYIAAGVRHMLKAKRDGTVYYCLYSHRDFDGLVTQRYVGNVQAYL